MFGREWRFLLWSSTQWWYENCHSYGCVYTTFFVTISPSLLKTLFVLQLFINEQSTSRHHHLHHVIGLLYVPEIILEAGNNTLHTINITNLLLLKIFANCITLYHCRPILVFFNQCTSKLKTNDNAKFVKKERNTNKKNIPRQSSTTWPIPSKHTRCFWAPHIVQYPQWLCKGSKENQLLPLPNSCRPACWGCNPFDIIWNAVATHFCMIKKKFRIFSNPDWFLFWHNCNNFIIGSLPLLFAYN